MKEKDFEKNHVFCQWNGKTMAKGGANRIMKRIICNYNKTVQKYRDLVTYLHKMQPGAKIILQGNLHVTKKRAAGDKIINNKMINRYNNAIKAIADGVNIFYIDANPVFDDKEGNLAASMTSDGVHILAKHYKTWGQWIVKETADI